MTTTESPEVQILMAVQQLDAKLSAALTRQTDILTQRIAELADRHNESLLEQEKRNASFAHRDRVEAVAEHVHAANNHVQSITLRVSNLEVRVTELSARLHECEQSIAAKTQAVLAGTTGYLVTFLMLLAVATISATVAHNLK